MDLTNFSNVLIGKMKNHLIFGAHLLAWHTLFSTAPHPWVAWVLCIIESVHNGWEKEFIHSPIKQIFTEHMHQRLGHGSFK